MNHTRVYEQLIARAIQRGKPDGYSECHHIVPRALGGGDEKSNLVHLTAREHFVAHMLLAKIHGGSMWGAVLMMKGMEQRYFNARLYEIGRKEWAEAVRDRELKRVAAGEHHLAGEKGSEFQRQNNLKRVEDGTHHFLDSSWSEKARENALKRVANGTHNFSGESGRKLAKNRIENGTHPFAGENGRELNRRRVQDGTHNFVGEHGSKLNRSTQLKRVANGTHHFAGEAGSSRQKKLVAEGKHHLAGEVGSEKNRQRVAAAAPVRKTIADLRKQCDAVGIKYAGCKGFRTAEFLQSYIRDLEQKLFDHTHQIEARPCDNGDWRDAFCGWFSGVGDSARVSSAQSL